MIFGGNSSVLGNVAPGSVFGEVYACIPGQPMLVTVSAVEDTSVLFMNVGRVLTTCSKSCIFHTKLVQNLFDCLVHIKVFNFLKGFNIPVLNLYVGD